MYNYFVHPPHFIWKPRANIAAAFLQFIFRSPVLHLGLSIGGAFLFACLLVYDTQMVMQRFSAEEYVVAAITLYLDILNLFIYILRILQATNSNNWITPLLLCHYDPLPNPTLPFGGLI